MSEETAVVTTYTSSKGEVMEIAKMNNFHLMNALLKVSDVLALNPNGFGSAHDEYVLVKNTQGALKGEMLARLDTRPKEGAVNPKITVPLSESDLQEIESGAEFNWSFPTDTGIQIDVLVRGETEEDNEE